LGILTPVNGGVPSGGNLLVDSMGQIYVAYSSGGNVIYGFLQSGTWNLETVAIGIGELLNDQSLLVDTSRQPHLIFQNSEGHIIVASKTATGWVEAVDLGPGEHGTMVLGPVGDIHATFTSTLDKLVHYARLQKGAADTIPPAITVSASPSTLWPPNGKLVSVRISGTIRDAPGGSGMNASSAAFAVLDEYGQLQPHGSLTLGTDGRYAFTVALQASRKGKDQDGRHYTIAVSARDNAGNLGVASTIITVPHDQGQ
jgi:hypothetical protein